MYGEIAGTEERVRAIPGVRDRRVRGTKVRLYKLLEVLPLSLTSKTRTLLDTGWKPQVHMTPCTDLYSGQILVPNVLGKFQIVYLCDLKLFIMRISTSYQ